MNCLSNHQELLRPNLSQNERLPGDPLPSMQFSASLSVLNSGAERTGYCYMTIPLHTALCLSTRSSQNKTSPSCHTVPSCKFLSAMFPAAMPTLADWHSGQRQLSGGRKWICASLFMIVDTDFKHWLLMEREKFWETTCNQRKKCLVFIRSNTALSS